MSRAFSAWGTQLLRGDGETPENFTPIAELTKIARNGAKADLVDVTNFDSPSYREKLVTMLDAGDVVFLGNFIPTDPGQTLVGQDFDARALRNWQMVLPGGRGTFPFRAYVSEWPYISLEVDKSVTFSGKLAITGNPGAPGPVSPPGGVRTGGGETGPPSVIQQAFAQGLETAEGTPTLRLPNPATGGNYLISAARWQSDGTGNLPSIAGSGYWIPLFLIPGKGIWYQVAAGGPVSATFSLNEAFAFHSDAYLMEVAVPAGVGFSAQPASGNSNTAAVEAGGVSISVELGGFPFSDVTWAAAMFAFDDGAIVSAIAVLLSDDGFHGSIPAGWTSQFPSAVPTWSEILASA
jgi:hypothetical protein